MNATSSTSGLIQFAVETGLSDEDIPSPEVTDTRHPSGVSGRRCCIAESAGGDGGICVTNDPTARGDDGKGGGVT